MKHRLYRAWLWVLLPVVVFTLICLPEPIGCGVADWWEKAEEGSRVEA